MSYEPRLKKEYKSTIAKTLMDNHGLKNIKKYARKNSVILDIKYLFNQNDGLDFL